MKTSTTAIFIAICVSGLLLPAAAQTTTDGTTVRGAILVDQPGMNNTNPPDAGGPPADAVPGQTVPDDSAETPPAPPTGPVPARNQPIVSTVILPKGKWYDFYTGKLAGDGVPQARPISVKWRTEVIFN